jgi:hypothetical protein
VYDVASGATTVASDGTAFNTWWNTTYS